MRIGVLCSGLGNVKRGHEVFIRQVFDLLKNDLDITLYKGGGEPRANEVVVEHVPRYSELLDGMHVVCSPRWRDAQQEEKRAEIEMKTFAYSALRRLLSEQYDVIHCLEREVAEIMFDHRLLFRNVPKILFSNGGALPKRRLPPCDFVQEHTSYSLKRGVPEKSFLIPHGVDLQLFDPAIASDLRERLDIPEEALLVLSVGTICYWHKRMDHLIREVARVGNAYLVIVGQESIDSPKIKALGKQEMGDRIRFLQMEHEDLPTAYSAADVFALASLFETFGIVYVEAMAMQLPVIATDHVNQRQVIKHGVFVDMNKRGALENAIKSLDVDERSRLGRAARQTVEEFYDLTKAKKQYIDMYRTIAESPIDIRRYSLKHKIGNNLKNLFR